MEHISETSFVNVINTFKKKSYKVVYILNTKYTINMRLRESSFLNIL